VLFVYFSFTQQAKLVAEAMGEVLRDRGYEVRLAAIGFTDKRWAERFSRSHCSTPGLTSSGCCRRSSAERRAR
jgi:hypothetical protein